MKAENAIELHNVSLEYPIIVSQDSKENGLIKSIIKKKKKNVVLNGISLEVKTGEVLGIIGVNGSGKSTILNIISKILEPDTGSVEVRGKVATILELGMGFHADLSGRENIVLKGELYGFSKKEIESRIDKIIDYSGIGDYIDNPVRTYSSGMKSRLAFSILINVDADVMIVDEILSTGDVSFNTKAADHFKKILKDGKTVVYVSHSLSSIESICTRVIWLDNGVIKADGNPKRVCGLYADALLDSFDIVSEQAESGLASAQYRLSRFYHEGQSVEKNDELYEKWLRCAAEQGVAEAQNELADLLISKDLNGNIGEALELYRSAAIKNNSAARMSLSKLLGSENHLEMNNSLQTLF